MTAYLAVPVEHVGLVIQNMPACQNYRSECMAEYSTLL